MLKEKLDRSIAAVGAAKVIKVAVWSAKLHNIVADLNTTSGATFLPIHLRYV
ncbi:MAG: hypothetical protein WBZ36_01030 [Candidatus Nitrosopolaris sp.]